jgi:periplasmic protein TonB
MTPHAHLTIRAAFLAAACALTGASAQAADFKWVQDAKSCEPPQYPRESLAKGEQGTTALRILVGTDGKAIDSEIEQSSTSRKLDRAAQNALMSCSFKPMPADAKPVQQWVKTEFVWKLN